MSDRVFITRIDKEPTPVNLLVQISDSLHVLHLEEYRVLETLDQQVVVLLLHEVAVVGLHLLFLHLLKEGSPINRIFLLSRLALLLLLLTVIVDVNLVLRDPTFQLVRVDLVLVNLLSQLLLVVPLQLLLLKDALLAELVDLKASALELLLLRGLLLDLEHL